MCCRKMCPWLGNFWNYYSEMSLSAHLKASSLFSDRINIAIIISDAEPFPFVIWPLLPQIHYIIPLAACNRSATGARGKLSSCTLSLPWCCGFIRKFLSLRLREYKKKKRAWPPFFYSVSFPASRFFTGSAAYLNSICPAKKFSAARRRTSSISKAIWVFYASLYRIYVQALFSLTETKRLDFFYGSAEQSLWNWDLLRSKVADCSGAQFEYWFCLELSVFHISAISIYWIRAMALKIGHVLHNKCALERYRVRQKKVRLLISCLFSSILF